MGSQGGFGQSKEFLDLVKSIGEARSKAEEDRIVLREIETLKRRIAEPDTPKRKMKEYIIRLVYVEMLGHDASFGYIHAVKMTHDDNLLLKRTGYLAVTLFLNEDHDLIILIVNTIQKDLKSDNYLVVSAALNAVCKLINEETIPAVLPQIVELLGHAKEAVRKKAVMALHRFYQRSPASVTHVISNFRKRLCDSDPGVMGATLCPLFDLITIDANSYKDLVVSFVSILKQVAECRLPKSYDYHQMPAPFIQIKLLKILALLGSGDKQASEHMYTVVGDIMRKRNPSSNIGNAILYECICCVSSIHPSPKLLESAADAISSFLKSDSHNLKYLGIDALGRLIKISPEIAEQHQLAVIDCLEDSDDTLKRKTFELLYKMTKSSNVEVIVDRMIDYMININDNHYKTEIASRCVELAEQFAPSNQWFIQTINRVFQHAGDLVNIKVAHNLMRLIAEGFGEDDDTADSQLRSSAVESYLRIIGEPKLPSAFLQVICWVLGEYGTADGKYSASYITGKLCDVAEAHSMLLPPARGGPPGPPALQAKVAPRFEPVDREKTCPLLLRVFTKIGGHHTDTDFAVRGKEPKDEVQIYTWKDATLRELTDLVKEVAPEARRRDAVLSFAFVYPDKHGRFVVKEVGRTYSYPNGRRPDSGGKALAELSFQIGDYLDVAIL